MHYKARTGRSEEREVTRRPAAITSGDMPEAAHVPRYWIVKPVSSWTTIRAGTEACVFAHPCLPLVHRSAKQGEFGAAHAAVLASHVDLCAMRQFRLHCAANVHEGQFFSDSGLKPQRNSRESSCQVPLFSELACVPCSSAPHLHPRHLEDLGHTTSLREASK